MGMAGAYHGRGQTTARHSLIEKWGFSGAYGDIGREDWGWGGMEYTIEEDGVALCRVLVDGPLTGPVAPYAELRFAQLAAARCSSQQLVAASRSSQ